MADEKVMVESLIRDKEALTKAVATMDEDLTKYRELGTPEEITEAFDKMVEFKKSVEGLNLQTVSEDLQLLEQYKAIGTPARIDEAIDRASELLLKYKDLGTPEEIQEAFSSVEAKLSESKIDDLALKYNFEVSAVKDMYESCKSIEAVETLLKSVGTKKEEHKDLNEDHKNKDRKTASQIARVVRSLV